MELVEGETLAAWLQRERHPRDKILRVFAMAGQGLAAAHRAGIVHRDFKPQNVMVSPDGAPHVMDFGLAAVAAAGNTPRLTRVGSILGTPLYMSPEQLLGQPADARADQYSFCVALYEALYGERPFDGADLAQLRAAVLTGEPPAPPAGSGVPGALRAALLRGLARDREHRFPDMEALLAAIARGARDRGRARTAASVATLALGALVAAGLGWHARVARSSANPPCAAARARLAAAWPPAPDAPRRSALRAAFLASGEPDAALRHDRTSQALDAYATAWGGVEARVCDPTGPRAREPAETIALAAACLETRAKELGALTSVLATADARGVRKALRAVMTLSPTDDCADLAALKEAPGQPSDPAVRARLSELGDRLLALRAQAVAGDDWQTLEPMAGLVADVRAAGSEALLGETLLAEARIREPFDPDGAVPTLEEAFRRGEATQSDAVAAEAAIQLLAIAGPVSHRFDVADRWARVSEAILGRAGSRLARLQGRFLDARGGLRAARGQWRLAAADFAAAVESRQRVFGPSHPEVASSLSGQARASLALGEPIHALESANQALAIVAAVYPADSYEVAAARALRGSALAALERVDEARSDLAFSRETFERVLGPDHAFLAEPLTELGGVALADRHPTDARGLLERAWELRSTHVAEAGARERTAFALARAIWESAPADRDHALELAREARDGYAQVADLEPQLLAVDRWLESRRGRTRLR
jgi:hypothetical protein